MKSVILLIVLLLFLSAWGTGDINNDGRVNSYDCHLVYQGDLTLIETISRSGCTAKSGGLLGAAAVQRRCDFDKFNQSRHKADIRRRSCNRGISTR